MTRIIKFRGKDIETNELRYGFYYKPTTQDFGIIMTDIDGDGNWEHYSVIPETVGQYTGIKDNKDKEIYEDDVVLLDGVRMEIFWIENAAGFYIGESRSGVPISWFREKGDANIIVIGTIHDNPSLLNQQ